MCFSRLKADLRRFLAVSLYLRLSVWGRWRAEGLSGADIGLLQNFGLVGPLGYSVMKQLFGAWYLCWSQSLMVGLLLLSTVPLNMTSGLFISASPVAQACTWQTLEMLGSRSFHLVLYYCKHWGFGWLNIYSGGGTAIPRCHFTRADVCAAWLQTSISLWWLFPPPPSQTPQPCLIWNHLFLSAGKCKPSLVSPWNTAVDIAEVWALYRVQRLGESQGFWSICLDSQVQNNCVENPAGSGINSLLL